MSGSFPVAAAAPLHRARVVRRAGPSWSVVLAAYGALFGYLLLSGREMEFVSPHVVRSQGTTTLDKDNYGRFYNALYNEPDRYVGRTVHVTGFVSRGTPAPTNVNDFIVSRELMWCCAVDAVTKPEHLSHTDFTFVYPEQ